MLYKQLCLPVRSAELSPRCDATVIAVTSEVNDSRVSVLSFPPPSFSLLDDSFAPSSLITTSVHSSPFTSSPSLLPKTSASSTTLCSSNPLLVAMSQGS